jgi:hypothetical protein
MEFSETAETSLDEASEEATSASSSSSSSSLKISDEAVSTEAVTAPSQIGGSEPEPREVLYCAICSMPPEFWFVFIVFSEYM